ncbi:MAG: MASE3 domain-containing protein [bacterium]|nr:MASE3 domain-containing protein [bacterium]
MKSPDTGSSLEAPPLPPVAMSAPAMWTLAPPLALIGLTLLAGAGHFPLFHTLAELLSTSIAMTAFLIAATTRLLTRSQFVVWIVIGLGWSSLLDFGHFLILQEMTLTPAESTNLAAQLWLVARFMQAMAFISAPLLLRYRVHISFMHLCFGLAAAAGAGLIATGHFPQGYAEGQGPTTFNTRSGYLLILILVSTLVLFWRDRRMLAPSLYWSLGTTLLSMILAECALIYVNVYESANLVAHVLKIVSAWFIYIALIQNTLRDPFVTISRAANSYDAVPFPTIITQADGLICQVNLAAAHFAGIPATHLIGRRNHDVFHNAATPREDCPVCAIAQHETRSVEGIEIRKGQATYEHSVAPVAGAPADALLVEVIRDVTEQRRLGYLYEMLSAVNRAIFNCRSTDGLVSSLYDILVGRSAFSMLVIAKTATGTMPLHVVRSYGISAVGLSKLERSLADSRSGFAKVFPELRKGELVYGVLSTDSIEDEWQAFQYAEGIRARAIMPLLCDGELCGVVGLYADSPNAFDAAELRLLNEMAADMTLALNALTAEENRQAAEKRAGLSEARFSEVFEAAPIPMQIVSLATGENRTINAAHQQWLGYAPEEIRREEDWLERVFEDPKLRHMAQESWWQDCAEAKTIPASQGKTSPELTLRCKDGSHRIGRGTMMLMGDEAIIAWIDLTDMHNNEVALRESEQRFRSMIEQSVSGIYVHHNAKFQYVNPRFCEIMGRSKAELINHDLMDFALPTPENLKSINDGWEQLKAGAHNTAYSIQVCRKDGTVIELGINAAPIVWSDLPSTISMAADITERKRAEAQIASYVLQLEASMKGTLQAVSNMVELRDPYTAGHERRVGLIASAIGCKLGWNTERCAAIEMIGLVHDIGKIAIPAEILSKPSRLSEMEMALVRGHVQAGYDILREVPFPTPVAEIIYQHHERMDGSGYPRGLKGEEILIEARVLAIADVLESMSSHRPYRAALGIHAAIAELERGRGTQYDSLVVDAAMDLLRNDNYELPL